MSNDGLSTEEMPPDDRAAGGAAAGDRAAFWPPAQLIASALRFALGVTARRGGVALADQMVASGTNFVTTIVIGRAVAKDQFGLYSLGFTLAVAALAVQNSLISAPYMVYSPRLKGPDHARYAGSTFLHQLAMVAVCLVVFAAVGAILSLGAGPAGLAPVVWALAAASPFILLRGYARGLCFAGLRMGTALLLDGAVAVLQLGTLIVLAKLGKLSASRAFLTTGLACGIVGVVWAVAARRAFLMDLGQAVADLKRNWLLGKWVLGTAVAREASSGVFPWFVAAFHGVGAAGAFAACVNLVMLANPFLVAMTNLLVPTVSHVSARGGGHRMRSLVLKSSVLLFAAMSVLFAVMLAWGGRLVALVYGSQYAGYGLAVSLLGFSFLVRSFVLPVDAGLLATERPDVMMKSHLAGGAVSLTLGTLLVWLHGVVGAAAADVVKTLVTTAFRLTFFWARGTRPAEPD